MHFWDSFLLLFPILFLGCFLGPTPTTTKRVEVEKVTKTGPRGDPKKHKVSKKTWKRHLRIVKNEISKKVWILDWIFIRKCEILKVLNPPKCFIYKHFRGFRELWQNRKFHENPSIFDDKMGSKITLLPKIGARVIGFSTFWAIQKMMNFHDFSKLADVRFFGVPGCPGGDFACFGRDYLK